MIKTKVNNELKEVKKIFTKKDGSMEQIKKIYCKVNGSMEKVFDSLSNIGSGTFTKGGDV